jgi:hypothetical protein
MQVTIDTRHDTLEEAVAVIQLAFGLKQDLRTAEGTPEETEPARKAVRSGGKRGSARAARARNDVVAAPAVSEGLADQADAQEGVSAAAVEDTASKRTPASARTAPTKKAATKKVSVKPATAKSAPASRSLTKRAPASRSRASRNSVESNVAPLGQADVVRAWARDQGMQVKAAGRMPAAVIAAYHDAHS